MCAAGKLVQRAPPSALSLLVQPAWESWAPSTRPQNLGPKSKAWASSPQGEGFGWGGTSTLRASRAMLGHLLCSTPRSAHLHILPLGARSSGKAEAGLLCGFQRRRQKAGLLSARLLPRNQVTQGLPMMLSEWGKCPATGQPFSENISAAPGAGALEGLPSDTGKASGARWVSSSALVNTHVGTFVTVTGYGQAGESLTAPGARTAPQTRSASVPRVGKHPRANSAGGSPGDGEGGTCPQSHWSCHVSTGRPLTTCSFNSVALNGPIL